MLIVHEENFDNFFGRNNKEHSHEHYVGKQTSFNLIADVANLQK